MAFYLKINSCTNLNPSVYFTYYLKLIYHRCCIKILSVPNTFQLISLFMLVCKYHFELT